ncbi:ParB family chromosome partitioning protein [Acholeplasma morum]|jgi:ParB family chromosome partitioning protein|uniref:ParB/RepB/Spo0J family partition protein n=1 Tax=Paracholeplasma morum TaxID=264637 RepID=UPI001F2B5E1D|nr:ParB/RepB/Spo0J family partition protein [Paracholeplasma morum]MBM7452956.1 ParB family chromosome partitioning protein [Paracholeplasma morum]
MKTNSKVLGRGLKDLLLENTIDDVLEGEKIVEIAIEEITANPYQPRRVFDPEKINDLAQSIAEHGIFQPIIVKAVKDGYMIVSGERRYRAAKQVGLKTVPSIIRSYDPGKVAEISLVENLQRENLSPIEEAEAYANIMRTMEITQKSLSEKIGKSRSYVTNILGLLNLPEEVQTMLLNNELSMAHARVLSKLDDSLRIKQLARKIIEQDLSVRQIEALAQKEEKTNKQKREPKAKVYVTYEQTLKDKLGMKTTVTDKKLVINYKSLKELEELVEKLSK